MNENPRPSCRAVLTTGLFAALGLLLVVVALLFLAAILDDLDLHVNRIGWRATAVALALPVVAATAGAALLLASLRRWNMVWRAVLIAIWLICAIAFVHQPLRD